MVIFYKKWKKYNEIQLTNTKWTQIFEKMTNHPPSPVITVTCDVEEVTSHVTHLQLISMNECVIEQSKWGKNNIVIW